VGSNRAEASLERLQELNPMVSVFFSLAFHFYGKLPVGFTQKEEGGAGGDVKVFCFSYFCLQPYLI
jgi:hypothetical protein